MTIRVNSRITRLLDSTQGLINLIYIVIGLISSVISIARLYVTDQEVLTELVWAEDGLFPLCVANNGYWDCLWDPYAGYFPFLARTLATPVAFTPLDSWPLATNLVAAISYGAVSVVIYWLLIRMPIPRLAAGFGAIVPVLLPITGLEAVNTAGSLYTALLVAATIAVSASFQKPLPSWFLPTLLLVTALAIPVALLLALPLAFRYLRKTITFAQLLPPLIGLAIGSTVQFAVVISAAGQRPVGVSSASVMGWVDGSATAVAALVGFRTEPISRNALNWADSSFALPLALALTAAAVVLGFWMLVRSKLETPALMILSGVAFSAATAIPGANNNRYYITFSALVVLSIVIALTQTEEKSKQIAAAIIAGTLSGLWLSHFPAGLVRATPEPRWNYMLEEARARCVAEPERVDVVLRFTPVWPPDENNLSTLNRPLIACPDR